METSIPREKGFVLIVTCMVLAIVLGLAGLAIDAGRMYVVRSELQAFTDSASLSAALELDGTLAGLRKAREAAAVIARGEHSMRWDLGSKSIDDFKLSFAKGVAAPDDQSWQDAPRDGNGYRFAKVMTSVPVPLTFLRALPGIQSDSSKVAAASVAGIFEDSANRARLIE